MMFRSLFIYLFFVALSVCCATVGIHSPTTESVTTGYPEATPIALMGARGAAYACPILLDDKALIVTASHVAFRKVLAGNGEEKRIRILWNAQVNGKTAQAVPALNHNFVDLATLVLSIQPMYYFSVGEKPSIGDEIFWVEHDFRTVKKAYHKRLRAATVVNTLAGHIITSEAPTRGASGSCVHNSNYEVIGIISFRQGMEDGGGITGVVSIDNLR